MTDRAHQHEKASARTSAANNLFSLVVCGLAVGWMVGLSASPVVEKVIEGVLGIAVSALATFAGIKPIREDASGDLQTTANPSSAIGKLPKVEINILPLATFTLFLAVGGSLGVLARTNELLGVRPYPFIARWSGLGLSTPTLTRELLKSTYSLESETPDPEELVFRWSQTTGLPKEAVAARLFENTYPLPSMQDARTDPQSFLKKWMIDPNGPNKEITLAVFHAAYPVLAEPSEKSKPESPKANAKPEARTTTGENNSARGSFFDAPKGVCNAYISDEYDHSGSKYAESKESGINDFLSQFGRQPWVVALRTACKTPASFSACAVRKMRQTCQLN